MNVRLVFRLVVVVSLTLGVSTAEAQVSAITAGKLINPETGTTLLNQTVVIEDGIIRAVGDDVEIPDGAERIDLSSLTVLPGLFDAHTHVGSAYDADNSSLMEYTVEVSTAERAIQSFLAAQSFLDAGFTTIRDLGNAGHFADAALLQVLSAPPIPNTGQVAGFAAPRPGQIGRALPPMR